ncbi:LuxR C-terminal-related transcriptional regulator [Rhodococcus sp. T2V]|uniref:LuxR C-terminal-related transcriptional regulator n=1 Tax=Rhodococcus sp. T2V TaxID=3034164 RepID=UPI0023E18629|nr:LuxR C-terminal-related transcriptional regulator [Rhodococcus sp. T2V]MDF3307168.1 LuxR C-terminal-related transcriptional regulator [Rhodococcus sp. T2V]
MVRRDARLRDTLPVEITSLVGRQTETAEIKSLLAHSRLVTLTGPGGVGKTRLGYHVARQVRGAFADGVWTIPLADLSQPDLIAATVAARIGISLSAGDDLGDLVAAIDERQMLLVLDNCEHLVDAVADVTFALLCGCPSLRVLATSREVLRVEGEAPFRVPPLALPSREAGLQPGKAQSYASVALFLERAGALNPDIAAGRYDEQSVVELCRQLDGLPLAIELAAAGSRWLSVESMLTHGGDPLAPATRVSRSTPERHRSLRASLDYSYDLCTSQARVLWARLSVFRGGATLEAVQAVCAGPDLPADAVWTALCELTDKSLVVLDGSRYTMLETIRLYGAQLLHQAGELEVVRETHLRQVLAMAESVEEGWFGPHQLRLLSQVSADQANVRAALEGALTSPGRAGTGLRIASSLWMFWISLGLPGEGRRWLSRLLTASEPTDPERAAALWIHGFLCAVNGDYPAAREQLAECERIAAKVGDAASVAHARSSLGIAELFEGRLEPAIEHLEAGVEMERAVPGGPPYLADALLNLGLAYCYLGRLDEAHKVLTEASQLCAAYGEGLLLSWALAFLGLEELLRGHAESAAGLARESLVRKRSLDNRQGMIWAIELMAWTAVEVGDAQRAAVLFGVGEARAGDFGPPFHGFGGMREWHDRYAARAATGLGVSGYRSALGHGRRLTLDEAASVALGEVLAKPDDIDNPLQDLPLTRREQEIARLVATGKTNREIADELVISPRTVDTHVQRILTKLDFTSRSQVAALIATTRSPEPPAPA